MFSQDCLYDLWKTEASDRQANEDFTGITALRSVVWNTCGMASAEGILSMIDLKAPIATTGASRVLSRLSARPFERHEIRGAPLWFKSRVAGEE